ncbi:hypothetical protein P7K49_001611 [Saguinus oedipus]|uniref:Uncharacterized protein n=1 Tax=Saguinus oedipus TaxID=9490 RepID=A0ABQ9WFL1_SAGOE|nr:hypothetical protein P7K49_001611 [Saguinus oedipus]
MYLPHLLMAPSQALQYQKNQGPKEQGQKSYWFQHIDYRFFSLARGISFGRAKGTSGSEADDETQLTFYTEQYRSRRRSKGNGE